MKKFIKKLLVILILIISYMVINTIFENENFSAFAVNQTVSTDINSIDSNQYPQIKEMLQTLKNQHPNWNFKILYTDIEWNDAIANEYVGHGGFPRNLVTAENSRYAGDWICKVCGKEKRYDNGNFHCASEEAIAYMIDPRNSANYSDIFQFMQLSYADYNIQEVRTMVAGTFLDNESYIRTIMEVSKKYNVNIYYIIARIIQEQGKNGSTLSNGKGYNGQYAGYYNVFNIKAKGNKKEEIILKGLEYAQSQGWDSVEKSIVGGAEVIVNDYIGKGQNTLYFQKFDVENSDENLYWHQYMQNILAAQNEGQLLRKALEKIGKVDENYTFIIPVYKNMPNSASPRPSTTSSYIPTTDLVKINVNKTLSLRSNAGKSSSKVGTLYKDEIVTRMAKASTKVDGTYWDYVMKSDGTKGYAARETYENEDTYKLYLVPVNQETPSEPDKPDNVTQNDKVKIDDSNHTIIAVPNATIDDLKSVMGSNVVVKNASGEVVNGKLATGYTVNDTNKISVLGDISGDGEITPSDYMRVKNHIMNKNKIEDIALTSADVNKDGKITPADYMTIKNFIMNKNKIEL